MVIELQSSYFIKKHLTWDVLVYIFHLYKLKHGVFEYGNSGKDI